MRHRERSGISAGKKRFYKSRDYPVGVRARGRRCLPREIYRDESMSVSAAAPRWRAPTSGNKVIVREFVTRTPGRRASHRSSSQPVSRLSSGYRHRAAAICIQRRLAATRRSHLSVSADPFPFTRTSVYRFQTDASVRRECDHCRATRSWEHERDTCPSRRLPILSAADDAAGTGNVGNNSCSFGRVGAARGRY